MFFLVRHWIVSEAPSLPVLALYVLSTIVVGRVGYSLYIMRTTVLDDQLLLSMRENQGVQAGRYFYGRVRNESPESCESNPDPCVLVELEDGRYILATVGSHLSQPKTDIVIVESMFGDKTYEHFYYQLSSYIEGDTEYRWSQLTRE